MPRPKGKSRRQWYLDHNLPYPTSRSKQKSLFEKSLLEKNNRYEREDQDLAKDFASDPRIVFAFMSSTIDKMASYELKTDKLVKTVNKNDGIINSRFRELSNTVKTMDSNIKALDNNHKLLIVAFVITFLMSLYTLLTLFYQGII